MGLINLEKSLDSVFHLVINELRAAGRENSHPFRFLTLATQSEFGPEARYVVLRKVDEDLCCYFFSDVRASKVSQINFLSRVALLFYNSKERVQLRVNGLAEQLTDSDQIASFWQDIKGDARKAYTSVKAPGEKIEQPQEGFFWLDPEKDEYFSVIKVIPQQLDVLQLNGSRHIRAQFIRKGDDWEKNWLTP